MNPEQSKLRQEQREESATEHIQDISNQSEVKEFATVEELLRYDTEQNPVPATVAEKLGKSLEAEPATPRQSWFKKLLGG
ncbi:MAG: hypothetical protein ACXW3Z_09640 [Limisphaerales bacterium]